MNDSISRQDAIDFLHEYFEPMTETDTVDPTVIYHEIDCLPSAEPQWTPVSERLPEDNSDVLVTTKQGFIYIALIEDWNGTMCWSESVEYRFLDDVVAWMPLPEPYEEK